VKFILLAILGLALVACGVNANNQFRSPKKATPPEGNFVDIDGTTVHYVDQGTGPALILIHGAGGSSREWTLSMIGHLTDRYRVIAIDRPGHGYTSRLKARANTAETLQEQADLTHALAQHLNIEKAIIAGQSYGGGVAMAFATRHPDMLAGLVMISGVSNPWEGGLDAFYETTDTWWGKHVLIPIISTLTTRKKAVEITKEIFEPDPVPPRYLDHMGIRLSARSSQIRANSEQINRSLEDVTAMVPLYTNITAPTEIIHGDKDTTVPLTVHAIPLSKQIKGANLTVLKGTGHMPQHAREQDVIDAIDRAAQRARKEGGLH
jgi:pimeloyl-ACP methyl ester carboxylesterase